MQDEVARPEHISHDLRRAMVDNQVRTFDVTDQRVLEVMYLIPRENFLPPELGSLAYSDAQITLKCSQDEDRVLMPPMFLAKLIQNARLDVTSRALVVASCTGYAAALVAELATSVVALDCEPAFSDVAARQLADLGLNNIEVVTGPLTEGHAAGAPYDVILIDGAVETKLQTLFGQLAPGGRLVTIETKSSTATRRSGKAMRYDNVGGEISGRAIFDATVPVLAAFRDAPVFVF